MRSAILLLLCALLCWCAGCAGGNGPAVDAPRDTSLIGEVRIAHGDTQVMLCGTGHRYKLSGPAMDTIADRFRMANSRSGQWMKIWVMGHFGTVYNAGVTDSALIAVKFLHLDASLHCDPVPDARISGSYSVNLVDPIRTRSVRLDLFTDGEALMTTDLYDGQAPLEEDCRWGKDSEGRVLVHFAQRDQTMVFRSDAPRLVSDMPGKGNGFIFDRIGPADRMHGAFGRTARWLAGIASAHGVSVRAEALEPGTTINGIFTTEQARTALSASARDTLGLDSTSLRLQWGAVATVRDAVRLMRTRIREKR